MLRKIVIAGIAVASFASAAGAADVTYVLQTPGVV